MQYPAAIQYLFSFINFERLPFCYRRDFNLLRIELLLNWFGHPERTFPSILIAGTKGKGSTASFLNSILYRQGHAVGMYTSPHLNDPRERIRINGRAIGRSDFAQMVGLIKPVIERGKKEIIRFGPITFFEVFTLMAILYFSRRQVDVGLFEVGMGGRLDATNVLNPLISILTPISFDHEEHLGKKLEEIAREKAAIIKPYGRVVSARQKFKAEHVIENQVRRQNAKVYFLGRSFHMSRERISKEGGRFDFESGSCKICDLRISLLGRFQMANAAVATRAAFLFEEIRGSKLYKKKVRLGLQETFWPGRFEMIRKHRNKVYLLDGAHNGDSMTEVCRSVKELFPLEKKIVILGTSREKNLIPLLRPLVRLADYFIVTKSNNPRSQEPKVILERLSEVRLMKPRFWAPSLTEALKLVEMMEVKNSLVLITGSLFLVGEARELLRCPKFI